MRPAWPALRIFAVVLFVPSLACCGAGEISMQRPAPPRPAPRDPDPPPLPPLPPVGDASVRVVVDREYLEQVLKLIRGARERIEVMQFQYVDRGSMVQISEALAEARARGLSVRVLLDEEVAQTREKVPALQALGIDARLDGPGRRMHVKMVLADRTRMLVGSTNWSSAALEFNHESNLLIEDARLGAAAGHYFEALFALPSEPPAFAAVRGGEGMVLCPDRSFEAQLMGVLSSARRRIDLQMYSTRLYPDDPDSPSTRALSLLREAVRRGVSVRVILERSNYNEEINQLNEEAARFLRGGGVMVRFDPLHVTSHAKLLITDAMATVGSTNWGYGGLRLYHELNVVVENEQVVATLGRYFEGLWSVATP